MSGVSLYGYYVFITLEPPPPSSPHPHPHPSRRAEPRHPGRGQQFICSLITDDTGWTAGCGSSIPQRCHAATQQAGK